MSAAFVFDRQVLSANISRLAGHLPEARLHYAVKACGEPAVLAAIAQCGIGFEVASAGELARAQATGVARDKVHCGLPAKGGSLIAALHAAGCNSFVFDCAEELEALRRHAPLARKLLRIRIDDIDPESAPWGLDESTASALLAQAACSESAIAGVTFHLARNYRPGILAAALDRAERMLRRFPGNARPILNIGGGYRVQLPPHLARKYDLDRFYACLAEQLTRIRQSVPCSIMAEPGRGIVESAAEMHLSVMRVRNTGSNTVEVALELNIGQQPGSHPDGVFVAHGDEREELYIAGAEMAAGDDYPCMATFVDTTCEYTVFYRLPLRRPPQPGETLIFTNMGAYTVCLASTFHVRQPPAVILRQTSDVPGAKEIAWGQARA